MKVQALAIAAAALAASPAAFATTYTQDGNLGDFLGTNYATFSNFFAGDVSSPFTPTSSELSTNGYRVYDGGSITGLDPGNN
jgi:hypothetical protein